MKYKYRVQHNLSFKAYFRIHLISLVNNLTAPLIKPLYTDVSTCFVTGCGHSGTTLVTAKLGNHPEILAFPKETNNFAPSRGLYTSKAVAMEWLTFTQLLGKTVFVEKTPKHIHSIKRITRVFPDSKFILMLRNPLDNCASLYKRFNSLDYAIDRWIIDNKEVLAYTSSKNLMHLKYELLTEQPSEKFKKIALFIGVSWNDDILFKRETIYDKITQEGNMALRQKQVNQPIRKNTGKWKDIISRKQAYQVLEKTRNMAAKLGYSEKYLQQLIA